jgi:hypothetical protein
MFARRSWTRSHGAVGDACRGTLLRSHDKIEQAPQVARNRTDGNSVSARRHIRCTVMYLDGWESGHGVDMQLESAAEGLQTTLTIAARGRAAREQPQEGNR